MHFIRQCLQTVEPEKPLMPAVPIAAGAAVSAVSGNAAHCSMRCSAGLRKRATKNADVLTGKAAHRFHHMDEAFKKAPLRLHGEEHLGGTTLPGAAAAARRLRGRRQLGAGAIHHARKRDDAQKLGQP